MIPIDLPVFLSIRLNCGLVTSLRFSVMKVQCMMFIHVQQLNSTLPFSCSLIFFFLISGGMMLLCDVSHRLLRTETCYDFMWVIVHLHIPKIWSLDFIGLEVYFFCSLSLKNMKVHHDCNLFCFFFTLQASIVFKAKRPLSRRMQETACRKYCIDKVINLLVCFEYMKW